LPEKQSKSPKSKEKSKQISPVVVNDDEPEIIYDGEVQEQLSLPPEIRRRVNALRKLQLESVNLESEFYQKVHELECEYTERVEPLNEKRQKIVNGLHEPSDEECAISVPFDESFLADELQKQTAIRNDLPESEKTSGNGLDEFWLTAFRNDESIGSMIESHDEPILRHLTDVEAKVTKDPMKFTLLFHFSPNEYFTNTTLTKEYVMKCQPDPKDPFEFSGPEITGSAGCKINWNAGKDVTITIRKKKQKNKHKGGSRIVTKEEKVESFFNFFSPPILPDDESELDEHTGAALELDYQIGQIFRDRVIPRAVLLYTGEAIEEVEGEDEDEEMDYDETDEEESGDDD